MNEVRDQWQADNRGERREDPLEELRRMRAAQLQHCAVNTRRQVRELIDAGQKAADSRSNP